MSKRDLARELIFSGSSTVRKPWGSASRHRFATTHAAKPVENDRGLVVRHWRLAFLFAGFTAADVRKLAGWKEYKEASDAYTAARAKSANRILWAPHLGRCEFFDVPRIPNERPAQSARILVLYLLSHFIRSL